MRRFFVSAAIAAVLFSPSVAQAGTPVLTLSGPNCSASILSPTYFSCGGSFDGNNKNQAAAVNAYIAANFTQNGGVPTIVNQGASDDANAGPFTVAQTGNTGTLTFDNFISGNFVLALKASNNFSLYYFTGAVNLKSLTFTTNGVSVNQGNGTANGLSHASLYTGSTTTISTVQISSVPEPTTYALMGAGLLALGVAARRRRNA